MQFYEMNICQVMIFKLYIIYKKYDIIKVGNQNKENSQVLL